MVEKIEKERDILFRVEKNRKLFISSIVNPEFDGNHKSLEKITKRLSSAICSF